MRYEKVGFGVILLVEFSAVLEYSNARLKEHYIYKAEKGFMICIKSN